MPYRLPSCSLRMQTGRKGDAMGQAAQQADERLVIAKATLMDDLYMAKFF